MCKHGKDCYCNCLRICCDEMAENMGLDFDPWVEVTDGAVLVTSTSMDFCIADMRFCPWCGTKFALADEG